MKTKNKDNWRLEECPGCLYNGTYKKFACKIPKENKCETVPSKKKP